MRKGGCIPQQGDLVVGGSQVRESAVSQHVVGFLLREYRLEHQSRFPDFDAGGAPSTPGHQVFKHAVHQRRVPGVGLPKPFHGFGNVGAANPHSPGALV